jgi:CubicO group peptidase (beta-lactamase class C family)
MPRLLSYTCLLFIAFAACKKERNDSDTKITTYFPPVGSTEWQITSAASLGWNETALNGLYSYLEAKNTKAFIILKNGRLVAEKYFGSFNAESNWYWASAGKTATAMLVGIAQQEGLLQINHKTSQYLGAGWTSAPPLKENLITIRHQLTMTAGLDDGVADKDCTLPACLQYKADAGTRWAYHNASYTLLDKVIETASGKTFNQYFQQKIRDRIGMNGIWNKTPNANNVYFSNARSMARFGLLLLNKGQWNGTAILQDNEYFNALIQTSQSLNTSYGYLTWLNGKSSYMLPNTQLQFTGSLIPNAPADMYAALGKDDQKIYVVPSQQLVVIRMGEAADGSNFALSGFDNELWGKLRQVMQ